MRFSRSSSFAASIGIWLVTAVAWAGTTGKIAGRVTDAQTGDPLPGVNVMIEGTSMGAATDADGYYVILRVPPGSYSLLAQMIGYRGQRVEHVRVSADMTATVNFQLEPTVLELGKEVTVVAERPVIQMDRTASLASVQADQIRVLPVREMTDVLELQAGLVRDPFGGLHIRGGRAGEVAYWVDGIAATDVYNGQMGIDVENAAIQELQVISGTFNAEYGQALSGIVNIVTKEGSPKFTGQLQAYVGDYLSFDDETYFVLKPRLRKREALYSPNPDSLERINPLARWNPVFDLQASLSGPLPATRGNGTFFANLRHYNSEGYLYGLRWFTPQGLLGDGKIVPMNPYVKTTLQTKFAYRFSPSFKLTYTTLWNKSQFKFYDHYFKYNPDALYHRFEDGINHILGLTHTLSAKTFYELKLTRFSTSYKHYLYENPTDAVAYVEHVDPADTTRKWYTIDARDAVGYVHPDSLYAPAPWSFSDGGTPAQHFQRSTSYWVTKFDLTSQVTRSHQVKSGFEARFYRVEMTDFSVVPKKVGNTDVVPFVPAIPERISPSYNAFANQPLELSAYVQDKMEFRDVIVNLGVRFDYFYPDAQVLADPSDPNIHDPFKPEHRYKNWSATTPESL
ncbi:MAG: carboxypeptidase regulatory-like domain-containing protein, partial [candidate division KSB1 bacterium]|nr:carboxypeptidase regulatory-like domain-containing protein [candidate division KSB1 bacterium]